MTVSTGVFISFEGIDGAGKSSHIEPLAELFRQHGRSVTVTREPGGTVLAEQLRKLVLTEPMDGLTEALLVFAARHDHVRRLIRPALLRAEVILSDRFSDSSFAYQGGGHGLDVTVLAQLERWVQGSCDAGEGRLLQPDLTLWFDLPPEQAALRLAHARSPDRFEARESAFFERVQHAYVVRAADAAGRFVRIDAAAARSQVWEQVVAAVLSRGWLV